MILMSAISVAGMAVAFPIGIGVAAVVGTILAYAAKSSGNPALLFAGCVLMAAAVVAAALAYRFHAVLQHEALARVGKAASTRRPSAIKGIVLALVSGLLLGSFFPLLDKARESEIGLGPYAVAAVFSVGVLLSTFVFNVFLMNLPVEGEPLELLDVLKSTPRQHLLGLAGGALWSTGLVTSLAASSAPAEAQVGTMAGYFMAQAFALLAALWGILLWKEFRGADLRVKVLAVGMFLLFACGLLVISQASLHVRVA
jgi:glucose uptake protein